MTVPVEPLPSGDRDTERTTSSLRYRPVRPGELGACAEIWRVSINDYVRRLQQPEIPPETGSLLRLYGHLQTTDPERFIVATTNEMDDRDERIVAFAAAVVRERLWFLSMLFVLPEAQGKGVGRALFERVAASDAHDISRATATDSAQPISNALYGSLGIVPRVPLLDLIGLPERIESFGSMPSGVTARRFDDIAGPSSNTGVGSEGHRTLASAVDSLDREVLGVAHPVDHRYLRTEGRTGWLYHGPDGAPIAYGYATEAGRIGPIASRDADLVAPIIGHLASVTQPRGAFAIWIPGTADRAVVGALRAGFRLDQFPVLLCWDRPFADLARYLPISPGLP